jgi:hypothetical protein
MMLGVNFRRQARVCLRLAEACDDHHLADRLKAMAADLLSKADETEEFPAENAPASRLIACDVAPRGRSGSRLVLPVVERNNPVGMPLGRNSSLCKLIEGCGKRPLRRTE